MKLEQKNNIEFLEKGGCFLYYLEQPPKCFLTASLIKDTTVDVFDDIVEKNEFIKHDCRGMIKACPYIYNLWNIELEEEVEQEEIIEEKEIEEEFQNPYVVDNEGDTPIMKFGNIIVDFDYSWPYENPVTTHALIIPTNTSLQFDKFVDFGLDNNYLIKNECKKRQLLFDVGDCILTSGADTQYPKIAHCMITEKTKIPENTNIGMSLYNALSKLDDVACQSIALTPLVMIDKELISPNLNLYLKTCLTTIQTFAVEDTVANIQYILIYIPPNFVSDLQSVVSNIS